MEKLNLWIQKYLVWVFPNVVATTVWDYFQSDTEIRAMNSFLLTALWEVMSWGLIIWFLCLFIFMVLLVFRKDTQELTIKRLAGIKERDEREEIITGHAARRSFVSTTSFLIFLFFLSSMQVNIARNPDQAVDGKKSSLTLGLKFSPTDEPKTVSEDGKVIYEHRDIPLSKSAILLLVLVWQVASFRFRVRRELKVT
ncbi:MAG: hypothetical protein LW878_13880 [Proteobacteria bacterium]|jgi:hypothetical protein|nr:hypothetical protein [Pseudomonadota bacterium]